MRFRIPSGTSLLLVGSGIYWILSSQLIASFTVLTPQIFLTDPNAVTFILVVGVLCCAAGLWSVNDDLNQLLRLLSRTDGWLYLIPILLAIGDLAVTLIGLSSSTMVVELNPVVASAVQDGPTVFTAFTVSYMTLSAGLTLLMLQAGKTLFPNSSVRFLSLAMICGAGSFGLLNNVFLLAVPNFSEFSFLSALAGAFFLTAFVFKRIAREYRTTLGPTTPLIQ